MATVATVGHTGVGALSQWGFPGIHPPLYPSRWPEDMAFTQCHGEWVSRSERARHTQGRVGPAGFAAAARAPGTWPRGRRSSTGIRTPTPAGPPAQPTARGSAARLRSLAPIEPKEYVHPDPPVRGANGRRRTGARTTRRHPCATPICAPPRHGMVACGRFMVAPLCEPVPKKGAGVPGVRVCGQRAG